MGDIAGVEFIIFDKHKGRGAYRDLASQLGNRSFDIALCMHASLRANLICRKLNAPVRLGFDWRRARDFQWLFTNRRIETTDREHALEAMMSFATHIGANKKPLRWDIPLSADDRQFAADFRSPNKPLVVISPCSSQRARNYRNWSRENYLAVIAHLRQRRCRIVITVATANSN